MAGAGGGRKKKKRKEGGGGGGTKRMIPSNTEKLEISCKAVLGCDVQVMQPSSCAWCKTVPVLLRIFRPLESRTS